MAAAEHRHLVRNSLIAELAQRPNFAVKLSQVIHKDEKGDIVTAPRTRLDQLMAAFGEDRVMFGGDWPVCTLAATYKEWLTALKELIAAQPEADQKKVLHDNAAKFYGI